jgi:hypothetical protein
MKQLLTKTMLGFFAVAMILFFACKKEVINHHDDDFVFKTRPVYSTLAQFRQGLATVANMCQMRQLVAYEDTTSEGLPDIRGRKTWLAHKAYGVLEKLDQNLVEQAVYDVFHFDGETFSLISYLMKAYLAGDISAQTLAEIAAYIPLPPIPVANFTAPEEDVPADTPVVNCCDKSNPKLEILVTWVYKPACGNYEKKYSGYAAGNTLTGMDGGKIYKFTPVVTGDPCPGGVLTSSVTAPAGASYGYSKSADGSINLLPVSGGTYTITFTYTNCGKTVTKTFTLTVK